MSDMQVMNLDWLRAELRRPGRSQSDLARHLKIDPTAVNKIVAGKRQIKAKELASIEAYLIETTDISSSKSLDGMPKANLSAAANLLSGSEEMEAVWRAMRTDRELKNDRGLVLRGIPLLLKGLQASILVRLIDIDDSEVESLTSERGGLRDFRTCITISGGLSVLSHDEKQSFKAIADLVDVFELRKTSIEDAEILESYNRINRKISENVEIARFEYILTYMDHSRLLINEVGQVMNAQERRLKRLERRVKTTLG